MSWLFIVRLTYDELPDSMVTHKPRWPGHVAAPKSVQKLYHLILYTFQNCVKMALLLCSCVANLFSHLMLISLSSQSEKSWFVLGLFLSHFACWSLELFSRTILMAVFVALCLLVAGIVPLNDLNGWIILRLANFDTSDYNNIIWGI